MRRVWLAVLTLFVARAARAQGCLTLGVFLGACGEASVALVDGLKRTNLRHVQRLCDCLGLCGGAESAADWHSRDTESIEADVEDDDFKVDV